LSFTDKGFAIIDAAVADHVKTQIKLTSGLSMEERKTLNGLLVKFLSTFEGKQR